MRPVLYLLGGKGLEETSSGGNFYQEPFKKNTSRLTGHLLFKGENLTTDAFAWDYHTFFNAALKVTT